jgi:ADP-ribose pyrophosphatase YjhB (NUDIX family)
MKYCPACGTELVNGDVRGYLPQSCPACGFRNWDSPVPVTTGLLLKGDKVVLVRARSRGDEWGLPSGFVESEEKAEDGLVREIEEETHAKARVTGWFGTFPIWNGRKWILLIAYEAVFEGGELSCGDEISEIAEMEPEEALTALKGKEEKEIIASWLRTNRNRLK